MAENYLELQIKINPEMADIVSEICLKICLAKALFLQKKPTKT